MRYSTSVPEAAGPANQSGVHYQNGIAARYLGRLCDRRRRPASHQVTEVRVEAVGAVDDVVVTYADDHRDWIHAKEHLDPSGGPFKQVWKDFDARLQSGDFGASDRLILVTDDQHAIFRHLEELAGRAKGARSADELLDGLGQKYVDAIKRVTAAVDGEHGTTPFRLLQHLEIEVLPFEALARDLPPLWMPESSIAPHTLYRLLRDHVADFARVRRPFVGAELERVLREEHDVVLSAGASDESSYRSTVQRLYSLLEVTGTDIQGDSDALYVPPTLRVVSKVPRPAALTDEQDEGVELEGNRLSLAEFFVENGEGTVLTAGAGFGKTEVLRALMRREADRLPAFVPLAALAESGLGVMEHLKAINRECAVDVDWTAACDEGRVLILFDGLDELSDVQRTEAIRAVRVFASRFEKAAWALTTRGGAAGLLPEAREVALEPLDREMRKLICRAWLPDVQTADALAGRIERSRELARMTRVPLFLALVVDHARRFGGELPTRRNEVLAEYVRRVLSPESSPHKRPLATPRNTLEAAAEAVAHFILRRGQADVPERDVVELLDTEFVGSGDALVRDLVRSGLLRRRAREVRFAFGLVGEYLAGRVLARKPAPELLAAVRGAASRPWIQASQFGVELTKDADAIVRELLEEADDPFGSRTLALGRAVANGAAIGESLRRAIGERIGALWLGTQFGADANVTSVLADGFAAELPLAVRDLLARGERLNIGGDVLLSAAQDDGLTRQAVTAHFGRFGFTFGALLPAVARVAETFVALALERAKKPRFPRQPVFEFIGTGCLLRELEGMPEELRVRIADDATLHPALRLSVMLHREGVLPQAVEQLVDEMLREQFADSHPTRSYTYLLCEEALWRLPNAEQRWERWVTTPEVAEAWRRILLFSIATRRPVASAMQTLRLVGGRSTLPRAVELHRQLTLAYLGDEDALDQVTSAIPSMTQQEIRSWIVVIGRYSGRASVDRGLALLQGANFSDDQRADLALSLVFVMTYDTWALDLSGGLGGRFRRKHASAVRAGEMLAAWAEHAAGLTRLELLAQAVELGNRGALPAAHGELESFLRSGVRLTQDHHSPFGFRGDRGLATTVRAFARASPLPLATLQALASRSSFNLAMTAYDSIAAFGSLEALEALLACQPAASAPHDREMLRRSALRLSEGLGVQLRQNAAGNLELAT